MPAYGVQPVAQLPPEVASIKSMLHIVRILAIIFGILLALAGLADLYLSYLAFSLCTIYCGSLVFFLIGPIFILIFGIIDVIIYLQMKEIEAMVDRGQYEAAKGKTMIWMILGFILGGVIVGILLLIAWLKFDPVITWQKSGGGAQTMGAQAPPPGMAQPWQPQGYQAPPAYAPPAAQPAPSYAPQPPYQQTAAPAAVAPMAAAPAAAPAGGAPNCRGCGKPTSFVPQYSRYYCYGCAQYA